MVPQLINSLLIHRRRLSLLLLDEFCTYVKQSNSDLIFSFISLNLQSVYIFRNKTTLNPLQPRLFHSPLKRRGYQSSERSTHPYPVFWRLVVQDQGHVVAFIRFVRLVLFGVEGVRLTLLATDTTRRPRPIICRVIFN